MTLATGRIGMAVVIALVCARPALAQEPRMSIEAAAGLQVYYRGDAQSVAFGFAPTRHLTLLISVERSHVRDEIDVYDDGYGFERGGTEQFVSGELRYAFLTDKRVSPYVVGGMGRGVSRPNVNEFFPERNDRNISVLYYGAGVRIPIRPRIDAFVDGRFTMAVEAKSDYFGVRYPVRAGLSWRF